MLFNPDRFSDARIVEAFSVDNVKIQKFWFERCRVQFAKGTAHYDGLSDYDRKDLFQDSFLLLLDKFRNRQVFVDREGCVMSVTRNGIHAVPDLTGYFMRIVKNKYLELYRSGKRLISLDESFVADNDENRIFDVLYWDESPEIEKERIVVKCLQSLPKSCLDILTKFYYEKKTLEEILEERKENSSYYGLKSRKSKCLSNLKKHIADSFAKAGLYLMRHNNIKNDSHGCE